MAEIYNRTQIEKVVRPEQLIAAVEEGFIAYSQGKVIVPPVGQLLFEDPPGDCHIKYGYAIGDSTFTIKVATGFYRNSELGVSSSNGVILVFSTRTGQLITILDDEGFLTDARTAAAGAVAAKLLAPPEVPCIGMIGTGIQGKMQLDYLRHVLPTRRAMVWARSTTNAQSYQVDGFEIEIASSIASLASSCNLIVTTTPSHHWLLGAAMCARARILPPSVPMGAASRKSIRSCLPRHRFAPLTVENSAWSTATPRLRSSRD